MSYSQRVINDPVFGFINIPNEFIYQLIKHPFVQRLNRIKQLGMASFVYPGAQHTRFHHSIGAMYLMQQALSHIKAKGTEVTDDEANGALACILLHDIGHGPFSHVLEHTIVNGIHHEDISLALMNIMNDELNGKLDLCISIFKNEYHKKFLHQLVSSQLDVDRLDYLRRDCFFAGVTEGNIGSERIIKIMDVVDNELVVESKGIYSIENFLLSRRLMYWQVYHHKTAVGAEALLINTLRRAKELVDKGIVLFAPPALEYFLSEKNDKDEFRGETVEKFVQLDDSDILSAVKVWTDSDDFILSKLSQCFIDRTLFKTEISEVPCSESRKKELLDKYLITWGLTLREANYFLSTETITTNIYSEGASGINILYNDGSIKSITEVSDLLNIQLLSKNTEKFYLSYFNLK